MFFPILRHDESFISARRASIQAPQKDFEKMSRKNKNKILDF